MFGPGPTCRWVAILCHLAEQPLSFLTGLVGRPGRSMSADCVPALATLGRPVFQDIGDGIALLPASGKA